MKTHVALLWHMHQPSYRDPIDGSYVLPWVRLHALKDYLGMVEILAETPGVKLTFNMVPSLVDQVLAYAEGRASEGLLEISRRPAAELKPDEQLAALRYCFMAHRQNLIERLPRFAELLRKRGEKNDEASLQPALSLFDEQDYRDLQVLSKLAWFDLEWQKGDATVRGLIEKGRGYSEVDKQTLAERERALLQAIVPAYRAAAGRGQVELSTTPYYHPILPLLCDTESHLEAHPGAPLPRRFRHPEDAADQVQRAVERHAALFGAPPKGAWPSEGSVSEETLAILARAGISWTASDEGVLERSAERPLHRDSRGTAYPMELLYKPWRRETPAGPIKLLFRDRALSDLIGFSYAGMEPERAAHDMLDRLRRVGERWQGQGLPEEPVVPVILDGENCWEHYRDGGRVFLRTLYRGLQDDPALEPVTMAEAVERATAGELQRIHAGSWINSDFSVWIGHKDDRRAWDLLGAARDALSEAEREGSVGAAALEEAREAFRAACGSDWCWWYGEDHGSENDAEFDRLYRRHLIAIHRAIGRQPPEALHETLISTRRAESRHTRPLGGVMPTLDGKLSFPDEWVAAGVHRCARSGAMHRGVPEVRTIRFGLGQEHLQVLLEASVPARELLAQADVVISFPGPTTLRYRVHASRGRAEVSRAEQTGLGWVGRPTWARTAADEVLEAAIPVAELRPSSDRSVAFRILVMQGGVELSRHPDEGPIEVGLAEVTRD